MSLETVRSYLKPFGLDGKIREFPVSSATVALAAQALGCAPARIAKTLTFWVNGKPVFIVAAGDAKIDNAKFKAQFSQKAKMLTPQEVETYTGQSVGGVCPFGVDKSISIFLDCSLKRFETVYPACGSSNSAIELTVAQLEQLSAAAAWIDVCRDWRDEESED